MNKVHIIHFKSYGFLHPGRERWRVRVIKRCWRVIPGSTLYGAVASALIKLDCDNEASEGRCRSGECNHCGYRKLLNLTLKGRIRFSPLIPAKKVNDALDYCREANSRSPLCTVPHAPIDRGRMKIHGDLLYGVTAHQPLQEYYGFVAEDNSEPDGSFLDELRKALRFLPFLAFGGRGKHSTVEADVVKSLDFEDFVRPLQKELEGKESTLELLTPMILQDGSNWLLINSATMSFPRLRRYKVWRTGLYAEQGQLEMYKREQTKAVSGVPEGSRFELKKRAPIRDLPKRFVEGVGNPDWTYLGWGQVIIDVK